MTDPEMTNPNNCATCDHKRHPDDGHCFMFEKAPVVVCGQHKAYREISMSMFASHSDFIKALRARSEDREGS